VIIIQILKLEADDSSDSAEAEEEKAGGEEEKGTELSMLLDNSVHRVLSFFILIYNFPLFF
jgi:hypothetical protein